MNANVIKVIDNRVYNLYCIKKFRQMFWDCYEDPNSCIENLIESWLTMTPEGQFFNKKAIDISWAEYFDQSSYELVIGVKGYLQPKHWTEHSLKFLDNDH